MSITQEPVVGNPPNIEPSDEAHVDLELLYRQVFDIADRLAQMSIVAQNQAHLLHHLAKLHAAGQHDEVAKVLVRMAQKLDACQAPVH